MAAFAERIRDDADLDLISAEFVRAVQTAVEPVHISLCLPPTGSTTSAHSREGSVSSPYVSGLSRHSGFDGGALGL